MATVRIMGAPREGRFSFQGSGLFEAISSPAPRNQGIDLLRGLSILLVIFNHIGLRIPLKKTALAALLPNWTFGALNFNGYEAVFVFFVISGFLITGNTLRRWGSLSQVQLKGFYARRFARIVPCLSLLVLVLSLLHFLGFTDYLIHRDGQSLGGAIASALGLYLNWYEGHTGYLPGNWDVLWSLSIEEVFYIAFPLVCLLTRRTAVLAPCLLLLALSLPFTRSLAADNEIWQEKAYLPGMAGIATGVLTALAASLPAPRRAFNAALTLAGSAGLAAVLLMGWMLWQTWQDAYLLLLTFSVSCILVGLHWSEMRRWRLPLPGFGWLRAMGRLSYEIYLSHLFVVFGAVQLYKAGGSPISAGWLWYPPIVLACWASGWGIWRWISAPADQGLRRRLLGTASVR
jgi:peptidoglycan/LPS O-acetylase OafA/YrhL